MCSRRSFFSLLHFRPASDEVVFPALSGLSFGLSSPFLPAVADTRTEGVLLCCGLVVFMSWSLGCLRD